MEFERLEQAWRSQANRPSEELQARLTEELMTMLKSRRRTEALLFAIPITAMTVFTILAGSLVLSGDDPLKGWLGLALMGICWIFIVAAFWNGVRTCPRDTGRPMRDTLAALLARNRRERRNYHVFWMLAPVFVFPMWLSIGRLQAEGRMDSAAGIQALALCGGALLASFGWNTLRFFLALKPQQRRLEALLAEYE